MKPFLKGHIMWLPKDERKTLLKYHHCLQNAQEYKQFIELSERAYNATCNLIERRLVHEITEHGPENNTYMATYMAGDKVNLEHFLPSPEDNGARESIILRFTLDGLDLAKKYDYFPDLIGLWCAAKEHQWLWFIIMFVSGFLAKGLFEIFLQ